MHDYFISYNNRDRQWAEWIAWQLEEAGFTVIIQSWDFRPGTNFVLEMHSAAQSAARTIAVLSPDFLSSPFTQPEWASAFASDPTSTLSKLIPVKVRECAVTGLLSAIVYVDLVGLSEDAARTRLLDGVARSRTKPRVTPAFPLAQKLPRTPTPPLPSASRPIQLLHISGLQLRASHANPIKAAAMSALPSALAAAAESANIAAVLISGDLTSSGSTTDFLEAQKSVADLCSRLALSPAEHCFVVPGNHDVFRPAVGPADSMVLGQLADQEQIARILAHPPTMFMLSSRLRNYYDFTEAAFGRARAWRPDRPWQVAKRVVGAQTVAFIQLNSAWAIASDASIPVLGEYQVREVLSEAGDVDVRVWLLHHPFEMFSSHERGRLLPLFGRGTSADLFFTSAEHAISSANFSALTRFEADAIDGRNPSFNLVTLADSGGAANCQRFAFDIQRLQWMPTTPLPFRTQRAQQPPDSVMRKSTSTGRKVGASTFGKRSALATSQLSLQSFERQPLIRSVSRDDIDAVLLVKRPVLLMTAVETELRTVLSVLRPIHPRRSVLRTHIGQETYYIGTFGAVPAVVTMCGMGAIGRDAVLLAAQQAISELKPIAVIMIGIAFGKDPSTQSIGDVLVASQVISYEPQKVQERSTVQRGPISLSGPILLNRFRQALNWTFTKEDGQEAKAIVGPVLSGEKLVNSAAYRNGLFADFPQAIGGEMEGAGLAAVSARAQIEWILAKGICDWADGHKHDNYQSLAAQCATSLVYHVLSDPTALDAARGLTPRSS